MLLRAVTLADGAVLLWLVNCPLAHSAHPFVERGEGDVENALRILFHCVHLHGINGLTASPC